MKFNRLFAVDPSLTCSGWALFNIAEQKLLAVGKVRSLPPSNPLSKRLENVQNRISQIYESFQVNENDIIVCEAPTTMRDPRAAFKVEQVRGIFEALGRERGAIVPGRLNPRTIQSEVMGLRGVQKPRNEVKELAAFIVERLYLESLKSMGLCGRESPQLKRHQDIVDAILVGNAALSRINSAMKGCGVLEDLFERGRQPRSIARRHPGLI
jgi:Holliday junction resolvasome RuvABC endonuclease subunit